MSEIAELDLSHAGARVSGHGLDAWFAEARETLKLAIPLALTQLAQMAIMTTDTVMLGHLSTTALASAALGNTVFFFTWLIGCGPTAAVAPMIAHILGARPRDRAGVRASARMGLWSVLILSVPLVTFLLFAKHILLFLGQQPVLAEGAGKFVGVLCWGLPFSLGYQVLRNFSTALSKPLASLIVMVVAIFFNAFGDYALIFGHFGAPKLGLVGSGTASACSYAFSFFAMLAVVYLTPGLRKYRILRRFHRPHAEKLWEVFRLGMPIGLTIIFEAMLFNSATLIMGTFGTAVIAAHMVAINVPSITFMVPLGIGMAATVRVGLAAGARDGDAIRRAGGSAIAMGAFFMLFTGILIWMFPAQIASLYFGDVVASAGVIALAALFLHVAAIFQIVDGVQVVAAFSLRGLKDAHAPMWIAGASYWLAGFPVCLLLAYGFHMKGLGIWYGLAFGLLVAAAAMCARFWYLARRR
ncbi:MAG TPA: MATE family efflux transporter [Rhizomicrobium sp.]|jgi:MATE family multidrug resistance protein|nr:MATE family efflux transporter [Rhizomicrobium sp.]